MKAIFPPQLDYEEGHLGQVTPAKMVILYSKVWFILDRKGQKNILNDQASMTPFLNGNFIIHSICLNLKKDPFPSKSCSHIPSKMEMSRSPPPPHGTYIVPLFDHYVAVIFFLIYDNKLVSQKELHIEALTRLYVFIDLLREVGTYVLLVLILCFCKL